MNEAFLFHLLTQLANATGAFIITFPTFYQSHWEQRQLTQTHYSEDY